ncbi:molybdopterin cofactor-binding domain-containing protein [Ramlibacter sp.]|uniref:xanthine dehydrogenase family protein molybdopterin-binding subunit n=1 Tax=Ramlibacter sp. TaxID=1917967 RepID=UPI003D0A9B56
MHNAPVLQRRAFLTACIAAGGGLMISVPADAVAQGAPAQAQAQGVRMGAFLTVHPDSRVTITVPVVEMGQGAQSSLAAIIADELGADWTRVRVEPPPAAVAYQRPDVTKYQLTSGSWSVRLWYAPMRNAGAAAREMLVAAAASAWGVDPAACEAERGRIVHGASGRSVGFGEVAASAARLAVPAQPKLKSRERLQLIGRRVPRTDIPEKVDGSGVYGVDVKVPGMLYAAMRAAPVYGAEVESVRAAAIKRRPGIVDVVTVPGAVVVVADSWWKAKKAVDALDVKFRATAFDQVDTGQLLREEREKLAQPAGAKFRAVGDYAASSSAASRTVTADYAVPFIHHAPMEPMNCTARVTADACELWVPTQCQTTALEAATRLTGLPEAKVTINSTLLGGGFGRRIHTDFIEPAILAARAVKRPVKLIYSREEDMQHGFHRPAMMARMTSTLDAQSRVDGFRMRIVGPSVHEKFWPAFFKDGLDYAAVMAITTKNAASGLHYTIPHQNIDYVYQPTHVPIGYWRAVGASHNGFFIEGFVDEVAQAVGQDPAQLRRQLLRDSPRGLAVLDKAIQASSWGSPLPPGHGRGIAFCENVDSIVAQVAEVSVSGDKLRVHRVVAVIDCGLVINPDTIEAQMEGGIVNALSAVAAEQITIKDGRAQQSNFHDYPVLRMAGSPKVEVHIIEGGGAIGGVGEAMVPTLAPAVTNAIFAASGKRIRSLPLSAHGLTLV